jgi:methionyl-tRNA formyltransferase
MRIVVLTSIRRGTASYCLSVLAENEGRENAGLEIARVIYCVSGQRKKVRFYRQKIRKMFRIGLPGALNGIRIRKWFGVTEVEGQPIEDIELLCKRLQIPFSTTSGLNTAQTIELLRDANADLGLSLGNSYISPRVFSIPRYGMLNIHGEILPAFQNAQSVIWQLYEGSGITGYTIHQVEKKIDEGGIWKQESFPIVFRTTLRETVSATCAEILRRSALGLADLLGHFEEYRKGIKAQAKGRSYTTPSFGAFLRIKRNFRKLRAQTEMRKQGDREKER